MRVCVCERERERKGARNEGREVSVCLSVCEREGGGRERESERVAKEGRESLSVCLFVCLSVCAHARVCV